MAAWPPAALISSTVPVDRAAEIVHDDLRASRREQERVCAVQSAVCTCYDCDPVFDGDAPPRGSGVGRFACSLALRALGPSYVVLGRRR